MRPRLLQQRTAANAQAARPLRCVQHGGQQRQLGARRVINSSRRSALPPSMPDDQGESPASTSTKTPELIKGDDVAHNGSAGVARDHEQQAAESAAAAAAAAATAAAASANGVPAKAKSGGIPHRWKLVSMMAACFVICNMDKVNMSVAVIPMAKDLGWSATDRGLVSSSFFWGYSLTQVPAGYISTRIGGAKVLMAGVALWSFGTLIAPPAAHLGLWALCATRVLVGLGEGFAPSAATSVLARQVPSTERSRAVTTVWGGLDVGSVVGLLLSGPLIRLYGWPSVFYLFAALGLVWCAFWPMFDPEKQDPAAREEQQAATASGVVRVPHMAMGADAGSSAGASEAILDARNVAGSVDEEFEDDGAPTLAGLAAQRRQQQQQGAAGTAAAAAAAAAATSSAAADSAGAASPSTSTSSAADAAKQQQQQQHKGQKQQKPPLEPVPWGAFLRSPPVWAVTVAHFCFNWGYYTLLAWLPSYFELALGLNVQDSSFLTLIPYVAMVLMTPVVGPVADGLIKRGWKLTSVRKLSQGIAFVGPAACMAACAALTPAAPAAAGGAQTALLVLLLSLGFALGAWSRAGLYCNHQDLSPKYASALLGITNTAGALPGVLGVTSAGYLLDATGSWPLALFLPTAACQLFGAVFYSAFASSERQPWS